MPLLLVACGPAAAPTSAGAQPEPCCDTGSASSAQHDSGEPAAAAGGDADVSATPTDDAGARPVEPAEPTTPPDAEGSGDAGTRAAPAVSFATQVAPVLELRCGGCHGSRGGLTLVPAPTAYAKLVGIASNADPSTLRVASGDPAKSLLFLSITNDERSAVGQMPPRQALSAIDPAAVELIRQWIAQGASNN